MDINEERLETAKFLDKLYGQLVGFNIVKFHVEDDEFGLEPFPVFTIKRGEETLRLVISRDPEGNGGGFAFVEEANQ